MSKIWECKIGECDPHDLPRGADAPMREAIRKAYIKIVGKEPAFIFSGWGGDLTDIERDIAG